MKFSLDALAQVPTHWISRVLAPLLVIAALPAASALAETGDAQKSPQTVSHEGRFNPEMRARYEDGKLAFAKAALKLSDAQAKLFAPVEDMIRKTAEERSKRWSKHDAGERGEQHGDRAELSLPDRLDKSSTRMIENGTRDKAFASALRPLYDSFSPEQQQVAGRVLAGLIGGHGGERGEGHHGGHGWHHDRAGGEGREHGDDRGEPGEHMPDKG